MHIDCSIRVNLESECSIRVYRSLVAKHYPLCLMLSATYYRIARNVGGGLKTLANLAN